MPLQVHHFQVMGGPAQIQLPDTPQAAVALQAVQQELQRLEAQYSRYRPDSLVSQINARAGRQATDCDEETCFLFEHAQRLHALSGGLFDITSGIYRRAWNFAGQHLPDPMQLQALRPLVGWPSVVREGTRITLPHPGMEIDLGGLVKEYAVDRACQLLQAHGIAHALVSLAGDLKAVGTRPDGQAWQAGIAHPRQPGQLLATIALQDMALATSGDYERAIVIDGVRYAHILHPHTGWPVCHWQSVSVQADSCLQAGSLSTLAMLMQEAGLALLRDSGLSFLAIGPEGHIFQNA